LALRLGDSGRVAAAPIHERELLTSLLRGVSRSFYLTLRILPAAVRPQISLAYLLARAADTIADTDVVPVGQRLDALGQLRERILGLASEPLDFSAFAGPTPEASPAGATSDPAQRAAAAERTLLRRIEDALAVLASFSDRDRAPIRAVLETITGGQELDLQRFELGQPSDAAPLTALRTQAELDDYTYRVAGCVGEFWTKVCRAGLFPDAPLDDAWLLEHGVRFGKGLQLVNILRDLPGDLRRGRCYLPLEALHAQGLQPADLLEPGQAGRLRPLHVRELDLARDHLAAGWAYTQALPRGQFRVRLACAWPVLIGVRTLALLREANPLAASPRVKVSRQEVRQIMAGTLLRCPWPGAWNGLYRHWSQPVPRRSSASGAQS
jgi:farnesyl-diphosphate farnesyltransferase